MKNLLLTQSVCKCNDIPKISVLTLNPKYSPINACKLDYKLIEQPVTLNEIIPGIAINDPSGPAALGFKTGLISLFIS